MKWVTRERPKIDRIACPWLTSGLSRVFADDHVMLEHGLVMYDALYAWCGGSHHWPPTVAA